MAVRPIDGDELLGIERLLDTDVVRQSKTASWLLDKCSECGGMALEKHMREVLSNYCPNCDEIDGSYQEKFGDKVWNPINAKRGYGWDKNPWVWVYSFERTAKPEGWPV